MCRRIGIGFKLRFDDDDNENDDVQADPIFFVRGVWIGAPSPGAPAPTASCAACPSGEHAICGPMLSVEGSGPAKARGIIFFLSQRVSCCSLGVLARPPSQSRQARALALLDKVTNKRGVEKGALVAYLRGPVYGPSPASLDPLAAPPPHQPSPPHDETHELQAGLRAWRQRLGCRRFKTVLIRSLCEPSFVAKRNASIATIKTGVF